MCIRDRFRAGHEAKHAENYRINSFHLGEGSPKQKFRANMDACLLYTSMGEISSMVSGLVKTYEAVKGADVLMISPIKASLSYSPCSIFSSFSSQSAVMDGD